MNPKLSAALAAVIWGTTYIFVTTMLPANPIFTAAVRALGGGLPLLILYRRLPHRSWWGKIVLLGTLNCGVFFALFFVAAQRLPGGVAGTLQSLGPIFTVLIAWPPGQPPDAALETRPVFTEELLLVLPAGHPPVSGPQDVQPATLAVFEPGCTYRRIAQDWFAPRPQPMHVLELGSYHAILASVAGGGSAGVVPRSVLDLSPHTALLSQQPITTLPTLLAWRQGYRSAALDALQQVLQ